MDDDPPVASTEAQLLNRDIELIYKALRDERDNRQESDSDDGDDSDVKFGYQLPDGEHGDDTETQEKDAADAGNSEIQLNIKDGSLSIDPETCLAVNRAYQEMLTDSLRRVEFALAQNRARQSTLEEEIELDMNSSSKKSKQISCFSIPYFKDAKGMYPPGNHDSLLKRLEYDPYEKQKRGWTDEDSSKLSKAIAADGLKRRIQPLMNRKEIEVERLASTDEDEQKREIGKKIENLDREILQAKFTPAGKLIGQLEDDEELSKIDWMKISAFDFEGEFSEQYLVQVWQNLVHPSLSTEPWTTEEDQQLYDLASQHRLRDWSTIAHELQTRRSAFQCIQRFQTKLSPSLSMGRWLPEEDEFLKEMVDTVTVDNYVPWRQVSEMMEGRSQEQCAARWEQLATTANKKGRWTMQEDLKLVAAVHCYGKNWGKVHEFVPGRSRAQCRERWVNSMDEDLKYGNWTYEEDRQLVVLMAKYGEGCWTTVAKHLPGRTDNMVIQRYRRLVSWQKANTKLLNMQKDDLQGQQNVVRPKSEVVTIAGQLVEAQQAQQAHCRQQRHQDITVMATPEEFSDTSSQPAEPAVLTPIDCSESANGAESETKAKKRRQQATQLLEKLAKRKIGEEQTNQDRERELMEEDRQRGIYVPRPQVTNPTRAMQCLEKRKDMHATIMQYVRETLKTTAKGTPEQVYKKLEAYLVSQKQIKPGTVGDMLSIAEDLKDLHSATNHSTKRAKEIEEKLIQAVSVRTVNRPSGRPRKYLANMIWERSTQIEDKISSLMLTTLNVDKVGASLVATSIQESCQEKGKMLPWGNKKKGRKRRGAPHVSAPMAKQRRQTGSEDPLCVTRVCDERGQFIPLTVHTNQDTHTAMGVVHPLPLTSNTHTTPPTPRVYRKRLIGQAQRIYDIPPLPPSTTTLQGFKGLLLNRRALLRTSRLDSGSHSTGPAVHRDTADLHSSDITPPVVKKLSSHFNIQDIRQAKALLQQQEAGHTQEEVCLGSRTTQDPPSTGQHQYEKLVRQARASHDYELLKTRFHSLFLWPSMLSTFTLPAVGQPSSQAPPTDTSQAPPTDTSQSSHTQDTERIRVVQTGERRKQKKNPMRKQTKQQFSEKQEVQKNGPETQGTPTSAGNSSAGPPQ